MYHDLVRFQGDAPHVPERQISKIFPPNKPPLTEKVLPDKGMLMDYCPYIKDKSLGMTVVSHVFRKLAELEDDICVILKYVNKEQFKHCDELQNVFNKYHVNEET